MSVETAAASAEGVRACPFCSASMDSTSALCGSCSRFSKPTALQPGRARTPILDRLNSWIALRGYSGRPSVQFTPSFPRRLPLIGGVLLLMLSLAFYWAWSQPYAGWGSGRGALALTVTGLALIAYRGLIKKNEAQVSPQASPAGDGPTVWALGYGTNFAVLQSIAALAMIIYGARSEIVAAWHSALITLALTPLLYNTNARRSTRAMGGLAALYLLYSLAVWDIGYEIVAGADARAMPQFIVPFAPFFWVMAAIAVFPQVQLLRAGQVGIGRFRGDFRVRLFGSTVPIALTSAILLVCGVHAVTTCWGFLQWANRMIAG